MHAQSTKHKYHNKAIPTKTNNNHTLMNQLFTASLAFGHSSIYRTMTSEIGNKKTVNHPHEQAMGWLPLGYSVHVHVGLGCVSS